MQQMDGIATPVPSLPFGDSLETPVDCVDRTRPLNTVCSIKYRFVLAQLHVPTGDTVT
jgi:hypothetical protein